MKTIVYVMIVIVLLFSGCIREDPDGEGQLSVEVTATLNLQWENYENSTKSALRSVDGYNRRFVVEVRREGKTVLRQTAVPRTFVEGQTKFTLPEPLALHALEYTLAVWSDYVEANTNSSVCYEISSFNNIMFNEPYLANTDSRDCHYAVTLLDLRPYRDQCDAKVMVEADMIRPLAKYRIIATDVADFREIAGKEFPGEKDFGIRFSYGFYFPVAFNVWEGKPSDSRLDVFFDGTLSLPEEGVEELLLGSDYIFVNETGSYIPVIMEIISLRDGSLIGSYPALNVPYQRGYLTTIRGRFLSPMFGSGGIDINPDFDGDIDIDLDKL